MKKDNITEEQLDEMIKDLDDNIEDRIYQKLDEIKNDLKSIKSKFVKELTVSELKQIIREVISEELVKREISYPVYPLPPQPMPAFYENPYRPAHEVWCDTKTTPLNLKEPTFTNATINKMSYYAKNDYEGEVHG